jgi:hypothetical protein
MNNGLTTSRKRKNTTWNVGPFIDRIWTLLHYFQILIFNKSLHCIIFLSRAFVNMSTSCFANGTNDFDSFDLCKLLYVLEVNGEVFGFGMVYWVHGNLYVTFVVTIYGHCQNIRHAKLNK